MKIHVRRRVIYAAAVLSWGVVGYCVARVVVEDSRQSMMWLLLAVAVQVMTTTPAVLVLINTRTDVAYRAGFEAGQDSARCSAFKPMLNLASGATVTPIKTLHTRN